MSCIAKPEQTLDLADRLEWSQEKRCPYGTVRNVFGESTVSALLDYVGERQAAFKTALVHSRRTGEHRLTPSVRNSLLMMDLGPFRPRIESVMREIAPVALAHFGLFEPKVEPREFGFACYSDGSYFKTHVDTLERVESIRILSCIYYFAETPRRFSGGELRIHGFPDPFRGSPRPIVDVQPETDKLVIFPSLLDHEVLPVQVPSKAWRDGRFTVNCWIHRASAAA
jgi:predicted 2-oxoglutarate/Fe(II)-dependent dioxygenase YbiX